jgi:hypothetical protein
MIKCDSIMLLVASLMLTSCAVKDPSASKAHPVAHAEMEAYYLCMATASDVFQNDSTATPTEISIAARVECSQSFDAFVSKVKSDYPNQPDLTKKIAATTQASASDMVVGRVMRARVNRATQRVQ